MKKIFLLLLFTLQLSAFDWSLSTEAAIYFSNYDGSIKNNKSDVKYRDDLMYDMTTLSYFEGELQTSPWYIPTLNVSYMNIVETSNAEFNTTQHMIGADFDANITSKTSYKVINVKLFKSFIRKGKFFSLGKKSFYPGDISLDLGLNVKHMSYNIDVIDKTNETNATLNYIGVKQFVPLPYVGVKYYYYNLVLFANISAVGVGSVKASSYTYGAEYRIYGRIYAGIAYMSESFEAVEKDDTVTFSSKGTKFSVKYIF